MTTRRDVILGFAAGGLTGPLRANTAAAESPPQRGEDVRRRWRDWSLQAGESGGLSIYCTALSPDGRRVLIGGFDSSAWAWDCEGRAAPRRFEGQARQVNAVTISSDGRFALTGSLDDIGARLWDWESGTQLRTFGEHRPGVSLVAFSGDGRFVATSDGGGAHVFERESGRSLCSVPGGASCLALSPDGSSFLFGRPGGRSGGGRHGPVRVWSGAVTQMDVASSREIRRFNEGGSALLVAFSPDGRSLLTAQPDGMQRYDASSGRRLWQVLDHRSDNDWTNCAALSADGSNILIGRALGTVQVRNFANGRVVRQLARVSGQIRSVASSRGGGVALAASDDTTFLWDLPTGRELARFSAFSGGNWLARYGDGRYWGSPDIHSRLSLVRRGETQDVPAEYREEMFGPRTLDEVRGALGIRHPT